MIVRKKKNVQVASREKPPKLRCICTLKERKRMTTFAGRPPPLRGGIWEGAQGDYHVFFFILYFDRLSIKNEERKKKKRKQKIETGTNKREKIYIKVQKNEKNFSPRTALFFYFYFVFSCIFFSFLQNRNSPRSWSVARITNLVAQRQTAGRPTA